MAMRGEGEHDRREIVRTFIVSFVRLATTERYASMVP
jgi:hypothetical protein